MNLLRSSLFKTSTARVSLDKILPAAVKMPFRVSVEGNIGCGKSTFIKYFAKYPEVDAYMEPIDLWRNVGGHNLLDLLYQDLKRWNFTFQSFVQLSRLDIQTQDTDKSVQMFERSIQNNRFCFVEMARDSNLLSEPEYTVLCRWYDWIHDNMNVDLDLIVYLQSSPEVVYERVQQRQRAEEQTVSLEYLKNLHVAYENWLLKSDDVPAPVLTLNADLDIENMLRLYYSNKAAILGQKVFTQ
ncbi:thymidine kinase 2, mitochondrial [Anabrus simplex]|uniref:thymidine kinase 2, mitochondrial n=1 Tax=Anabrus simplex TaxID=316456 RepID=UPI0035A29533